jgi:hypothetical protein
MGPRSLDLTSLLTLCKGSLAHGCEEVLLEENSSSPIDTLIEVLAVPAFSANTP